MKIDIPPEVTSLVLRIDVLETNRLGITKGVDHMERLRETERLEYQLSELVIGLVKKKIKMNLIR